jgi:hypothetical protein
LANFDFDYNESSNNLTVQSTGGDSFDPARVEFQVDGSTINGDFPVNANDPTGSGSTIIANTMDDDNTVTAGDSITLSLDGTGNSTTANPDDTSDFELDIIFTSEDGGTSSEIGGTSGPEA